MIFLLILFVKVHVVQRLKRWKKMSYCDMAQLEMTESEWTCYFLISV